MKQNSRINRAGKFWFMQGFSSLFGIIVFVTFILILFFLFPFTQNTSSVLKQISDHFYQMTPNICTYMKVKGVNVIYFIYAAITLFSCAEHFLFSGRATSPLKENSRGIRFILLRNTCIALLIICALQAKTLISQFMFEHTYFADAPIEKKYSQRFGKIYDFANYCKKLLPGTHQANVITDIDKESAAWEYAHAELSYFLYPINIKTYQGSEPEVIVIYSKDDPLKSVPENFLAFEQFDSKSLIAVKNNFQ